MSKMVMVMLLGGLIVFLISLSINRDSPVERRMVAQSPVRTIPRQEPKRENPQPVEVKTPKRENFQQVEIEIPEREKSQVVMVRIIEEEIEETWER